MPTRAARPLVWIVALILTVQYALAPPVRGSGSATPPRSATTLTGLDYVYPASGLTGCGTWVWLTAGCYRNSTLGVGQVSPHDLLRYELSFLVANHLGTLQRLWVSLDQLMLWDPQTGYTGFEPTALANLDDALSQFKSAGLAVDLVLYSAGPAGSLHVFQATALNGLFPAMLIGYRTAVYDLAAHLLATPQDSAVSIVDLFNEAYYQLEQVLLTPANLGRWRYLLPAWPASNACYVVGNTVCLGGSDGHGCLSTTGAVDTTCLDVNVIEPFLAGLYSAARTANPHLRYTISDTERLLTTSTAPFAAQAWWVSMYPVDVYDIHLYNDQPWGTPARWATGLTLPKPWFAGEIGCGVGNSACTYNGSLARYADGWWLANLPSDGATSVLVEDRRTAATYVYSNNQNVLQLTPVGQLLGTLALRARHH